MKTDERRKKYWTIIIVSAIVFTAVAFLLPISKNGVFRTAYVFEMIAIFLQIPVFKLAFDKTETIRSKFLGFPVFRVGYLYLAIQTIITIVLFLLCGNEKFPLSVGVLICLLFLGAAIVCSLSADLARDTIEKLEGEQDNSISAFEELRKLSSELYYMTDNADLVKALVKLNEDFRYSDPVSSLKTLEIEGELKTLLLELSKKLKNKTATFQDLDEIKTKLKLRNEINKNNKSKM